MLVGQTRQVEEVLVEYCVGGRSGIQGVKTKHSPVPEHYAEIKETVSTGYCKVFLCYCLSVLTQ
jgi:hypothetical protein